jgi:hypothetical protein
MACSKVLNEREKALLLLKPVIEDAIEFLVNKKIGRVEICCFQGGVSNWNLVESRQAPKESSRVRGA